MDISNLPLTIAVPNILELSDEEYALARRNGLGASDASVYLNLQSQWKTVHDLIIEKCTPYITDEERAIGEKEVVRKGRDLEPLILQKAEKELGMPIEKPTAMYRHKEYEFMTINFDGVMDTPEGLIPVECKFVSTYGDKYYDRTKPEGIPEYYRAQLHQQMIGLNAPYGYLAALFDKGWIFHLFKIQRDEKLISQIIVEGYKTWELIKARKEGIAGFYK